MEEEEDLMCVDESEVNRVDGKIVIEPYYKILPLHAFADKIKELIFPLLPNKVRSTKKKIQAQ